MPAESKDRYWRFTDEVEQLEINMSRDDLRQLLRYIYADQLILAYQSLAVSECQGCKIDHPSQHQHSCIDPDVQQIPILYGLVAEQLDKGRLKAIFAEAAQILWIDYKHIEFERTLREYLKCWEATNYQDIEKSLMVETYYVTAITAATYKINLLEKRFIKR